MIRVPQKSVRSLSVILALSVALIGVGCGKYRTQFSVNKAKKVLNNAETQYLASTYSQPQVDQIQQTIATAEQQMAGGDYTGSVASAKQAVEAAKQLLDDTRNQHATAMRTQAESDMSAMQTNGGQMINSENYATIDQWIQEINTASLEGDHDDVILLASQVRTKTNETLEGLRQEADSGRNEIISKVKAMEQEQVSTYAMDKMTLVTEKLTEINQLVDVDRNYVEAKKRITETLALAEQGIQEARLARSRERLQMVDRELKTAESLGAGKQYAMDFHKQVSEKLAELNTRFQNEEYTIVLESVEFLLSNASLLVTQTKKEGAEDILGQATDTITVLDSAGATGYAELKLPLAESKKLLDEANAEFELTKYDDAKKIGAQAFAKADAARKRFDAMAAEKLNAAEQVLNEARGTLEQATSEGFFIQKDPTTLPAVDQPFEKTKDVLLKGLEESVKSVTSSLASAKERRESMQYHNSIVGADSVANSAADIKAQVERTAAHNALVELSSKAVAVRQDGAGEYAQTELNALNKELDTVRATIGGKQYRAAIDQAAAARAQLENTIAKLHQETLRLIAEAKGQIAAATAEGVTAAKPEKNNLANQLVKEAEAALGIRSPNPIENDQIIYKRAIDKTQEAITLVQAMRTEVNRELAEATISMTADTAEKAENAGASIYAGAELRDAQARLSQAKALVKEGRYVEARTVGDDALETARAALLANVTKAEESITNARLYRGWDFKHDELSKAIVELKNAQAAMGAGEFERGNRLARLATQRSERLTQFTKERDFRVRVSELRQLLWKALRTEGIGLYQPAQVRAMMTELHELDEKFQPQAYDQYNAKLMVLQGKVERSVMATPDVVAKMIADQRAYLESLLELGAGEIAMYEIGLARRRLAQAEVDYQKGDYLKAYGMLKEGVRLTNSIVKDVALENYEQQAMGVLDDLAEISNNYRHMIRLNKTALKSMVSGFHAEDHTLTFTGRKAQPQWFYEDGGRQMLDRERRFNAIEFSNKIDELYIRALSVEPHPSQKALHDKLLDTLRMGRESGRNFEQFPLLDQYSQKQRHEIIDAAYDNLDKMMEGQKSLRNRFYEPQRRIRKNVYAPAVEAMLEIR